MPKHDSCLCQQELLKGRGGYCLLCACDKQLSGCLHATNNGHVLHLLLQKVLRKSESLSELCETMLYIWLCRQRYVPTWLKEVFTVYVFGAAQC